jgi:hypothetical protein
MQHNENRQVHHRVQLPSGKRIEVVYVDRPQGVYDEAAPANTASQPLHVCFHCAGELVYPLDWAEEGPAAWRVMLRCPECEATREGVFEQSDVEILDDEMDRATGSLLSDLRHMTHTNMSEEIEFFVRALHADVIVPSDFQS